MKFIDLLVLPCILVFVLFGKVMLDFPLRALRTRVAEDSMGKYPFKKRPFRFIITVAVQAAFGCFSLVVALLMTLQLLGVEGISLPGQRERENHECSAGDS